MGPWQAAHVRVAIIGNFDGVHRGHQALIRRARQRASQDAPSRVIAVTFDPHPTAVLRPDRAPASLTSTSRRTDLLLESGADEVTVLHFTPEFAAASPEDFAHLLRDPDGIAADLVIVGANFRFGQGAAGDTALLAELGARLGFEVDVVPLEAQGPDDAPWSSSHARDCIEAGDLPGAADVLGRPHRIEGPVVRGDQRGRDLGYPTANVEVAPGTALPPDGVYAGWLVVGGDPLPAAVSIGTNPQFNGRERRVEAYALDRNDLDLYGQTVEIDLIERLRGQAVFASVADLQSHMAADVSATRQRLAAPGPSGG